MAPAFELDRSCAKRPVFCTVTHGIAWVVRLTIQRGAMDALGDSNDRRVRLLLPAISWAGWRKKPVQAASDARNNQTYGGTRHGNPDSRRPLRGGRQRLSDRRRRQRAAPIG